MLFLFIAIFKNIVNITTLIKEKSYNNIETKKNGGVLWILS
nr:MAG TPA: hypothetical protein [Caudoviricetes sp.]